MFDPITIPFDTVMLFNEVRLKPGLTVEDVELEIGEMCNVVKNTFASDGFIAGQVFRKTGQVSEEGSILTENTPVDSSHVELAIITYWKSFDQHEKSHADERFKERFSALLESCDNAYEVAYDLLWQGVPDES
jgi:hypothetical protein